MTARAAQLRVIPYAPEWFDSYRALAEGEWGPGCRQADPRFLRWASANPIQPPAGRSSLWLGVDGEAVVGCIHAMRLPWQVGPNTLEFPTLHDWLVAPAYRTGLGTMLLTTALRGERHAFIPAAAGELEQIYTALRCEPADSMWFRQVLRPAAGAVRFGLERGFERVFGGSIESPLGRVRLDRPEPRAGLGRSGTWELSVGADAALQAALLERLDREPPSHAGAYPRWTRESFAWRFFGPDGPWHLVVHEPRADGSGIENFCLLSVGVRHGLAIGRFMLAAFSDFDAFERMARVAEQVLTGLGAHVLLAFTLDPRERVAFARVGWRTRPGPPSFISHFPRKQRFGVVAAGAEIADFGFESIAERRLIE